MEFRTSPAEDGSERVGITGTLTREQPPAGKATPRALGVIRYEASRGGGV